MIEQPNSKANTHSSLCHCNTGDGLTCNMLDILLGLRTIIVTKSNHWSQRASKHTCFDAFSVAITCKKAQEDDTERFTFVGTVHSLNLATTVESLLQNSIVKTDYDFAATMLAV